MNKFAGNQPLSTSSHTGSKALRIGELLIAAEVIKPQALTESLQIAKTSKSMIGRTLVTLGQIDEQKLAAALELQNLMRKGLVNTHVGVNALRLACSAKIPIEEALKTMGWKSSANVPEYTDENELTKLLIESGLINKARLELVEKQSKENNLSLGRCLIINRHLTQQNLETILSLQCLIRENQITLDQALSSLKSTILKRQPIENALFEFGIRPLVESDLRTGNLLCLAGLISESTKLAVLEQCLAENKPIGLVLTESQTVKTDLIDKTFYLQQQIIEGNITLHQAADILKKAQVQNLDIDSLLAEITKKGRTVNQTEQVLDLLLATGLLTEKNIAEARQLASQTQENLGESILSLHNIEQSYLDAAWQAKTMIDDKMISVEYGRSQLRQLFGKDKASSQSQADLPSRSFDHIRPPESISIKEKISRFVGKLFNR